MLLIRNEFICVMFECLFIFSISFLSTSAVSTRYPEETYNEVASESNSNEQKHINRRDTLVNFPNNRVTRSKYDDSSAAFKPKLLLRLIR